MKKVNIISTVVQRQISGEKIPTGNNVTLNDVVDIDEIRKELSKNFISFDEFKSYWEIKTDAYGNKYIYSPLHIATQNGITMYANEGGIDIPTILNSIPTAGYDDIQARGLIAFNSKHFVINNGVVSAIQGSAGLNEEQLGNYLKNNHYATEDWVKEYIVEINTGETVNITQQMVIDALGFTPYDASNPNGYITSATLDGYLPLSGGVIDGWVRIQNNKVGDGTLYIKGISTKPIIRFEGDFSWGYLGFGGVNNPCYYDNALNEYNLIHSGNIGSQSVNYANRAGDADTLDGLHGDRFLYLSGGAAPNPNTYDGSWLGMTNQNTPDKEYMHILSSNWGLGSQKNSLHWATQLALPTQGRTNAYFRSGKSDSSGWNDWVNIVTSANIGNYNAGSATKLQTERTIWGRPFDGTGDVNGVLTFNNLGGTSPTIKWSYGEYFDNRGNFHLAASSGDFNIYNSSSDVLFRVVHSSGNVGIGTNSPSTKLHIIQSNFDDGITIDRSASGAGASIRVNSNGTYIGNFGISGNKIFEINLHDGSNLKNVFLVNLSGNVGIGTISPSEKLHVNGNILSTGGITMYSARILKNIVDERGLSLNELSVIKPTRYTWKDGRDNNIHFGGIADDIQQVLPEVVYKTAEGVLTMDYGNAGFAIAASLIKPVVDHEEKIRQLQKRVSELEQELNRLRA